MKNTRWDGTRPLARVDDLVSTEIDGKLLVYDERVHALHTLDPFAMMIWRTCDGFNDVRSIQAICSTELPNSVSERDVEDGLEKLADVDLLQGWLGTWSPAGGRASRRKLLKRTTVAGAAIASVTMPLATAHATGDPVPCVPPGGACSTVADCCQQGTGCGSSHPAVPNTCGGG